MELFHKIFYTLRHTEIEEGVILLNERDETEVMYIVSYG